MNLCLAPERERWKGCTTRSHQYLSIGELAGSAYRDNYVLVILRENRERSGLELSGMVAPPEAKRAVYALFGDEGHYSLLEPMRPYSPAQAGMFSQAPPAIQPVLAQVYAEQQEPRTAHVTRRSSWLSRPPTTRLSVFDLSPGAAASPTLPAATAAAPAPAPASSWGDIAMASTDVLTLKRTAAPTTAATAPAAASWADGRRRDEAGWPHAPTPTPLMPSIPLDVCLVTWAWGCAGRGAGRPVATSPLVSLDGLGRGRPVAPSPARGKPGTGVDSLSKYGVAWSRGTRTGQKAPSERLTLVSWPRLRARPPPFLPICTNHHACYTAWPHRRARRRVRASSRRRACQHR